MLERAAVEQGTDYDCYICKQEQDGRYDHRFLSGVYAVPEPGRGEQGVEDPARDGYTGGIMLRVYGVDLRQIGGWFSNGNDIYQSVYETELLGFLPVFRDVMMGCPGHDAYDYITQGV